MRKQRILAVLTALVLSLSGCGRTPQKTGATLKVQLSHAWRSERVTLFPDADPWEHFTDGMTSGNILCCLGESLLLDYGDTGMFLYDLTTGTAEPFTFQCVAETKDTKEIAYPETLMHTPDGGLLAIFGYTDKHYRMLDRPRIYEQYDGNFQLTGSGALPEGFASGGTFGAMDGAGYYYSFEPDENMRHTLLIYDTDFQQTGTVDSFQPGTYSYAAGTDGNFYLFGNYGNSSGKALGIVNPETCTVQTISADLPAETEIYRGNETYPVFIKENDALYGLQTDGNLQEVIRWDSSCYAAHAVSDITALPDGRFALTEQIGVVVSRSYISRQEQWILSPRSQEELDAVRVLTLAKVSKDDTLPDIINRFNRQNPECYIILKDYAVYNTENDQTLGLEQLKSDMLAGLLADIICTDGLPFESFYRKGLFEDLSGRVANDPDFTDEKYYMNFFRSLRYGESLPKMGFSFQLKTLAAKTELVGDVQGMTPEVFMQLIQSAPEGMRPFSDTTREGMFRMFCTANLRNFIQPETRTCSFNSPEFLEILQICADYPAENQQEMQNWSSEQLSDWLQEQETAYRQDKALFADVQLYTPYAWHEVQEGQFGNAPVTMTGYPVQDGSNGAVFVPEYELAINRESFYSDEAWQFFKFLLSDAEQSNLISDTMPVSRAGMRTKMQEAMSPVPSAGDIPSPGRMYGIGSSSVYLQNASEEEMQELDSYITQTTVSAFTDAAISQILTEETAIFFAGDQSAEETAQSIQSRISLYLSEQS